MKTVDQQALRSSGDAYKTAREQFQVARQAANAAWVRHANTNTIEYEIEWQRARKREAETAERLANAERAYVEAGGYALDDSNA